MVAMNVPDELRQAQRLTYAYVPELYPRSTLNAKVVWFSCGPLYSYSRRYLFHEYWYYEKA